MRIPADGIELAFTTMPHTWLSGIVNMASNQSAAIYATNTLSLDGGTLSYTGAGAVSGGDVSVISNTLAKSNPGAIS